ncbi:MAG: hypothetical protein VXX85_04250 [Candidatus Margulisiibacteriota bacterium]|nr:hypothetical protein [Candidatus Margulisiibacteriota bacterium]
MRKQLITTIVNNIKKTYVFNKRWRPTITFSVGRLLWGWIPPQFFSIIT